MRRTTVIAAGLVVALALGGCGKSPEDKARDDGKNVGEATRALFDAQSPEEARAAAGELKTAVSGLGEDARDAVREQVETQSGTLSKAADAVRAGDTTELKSAVDEIRSQAASFRDSGDSVANEFWRGFQDGYDSG